VDAGRDIRRRRHAVCYDLRVKRSLAIGVVALVAVIVSCGSGSGEGNPAAGGGGSGGSGATGGSTNGGSSGLGGSGVYGNVCATVEALTCWGGDCESVAQGDLEQANARGCTQQLVAAFDCYEEHPPSCDPQEGFTPDAACDAVVETYNACLQGSGTCTMAGLLVGCAVVCGTTWGAQCTVEAGNSYWDCNCRVGPKLGTTFTLPTVDKCDEALSAEYCAP
jgi:hypothetical protein